MHHAPTAQELAHRETTLHAAISQAEARARHRLEEAAVRLDLAPNIARGFVLAGLEVARAFAAETTYARYEHRTGTQWPEEWRDLDEEEWEASWRLVLDVLDTALANTPTP